MLVHGDALLADGVSQEIHLWLEEAAFGKLAVELLLTQEAARPV